MPCPVNIRGVEILCIAPSGVLRKRGAECQRDPIHTAMAHDLPISGQQSARRNELEVPYFLTRKDALFPDARCQENSVMNEFITYFYGALEDARRLSNECIRRDPQYLVERRRAGLVAGEWNIYASQLGCRRPVRTKPCGKKTYFKTAAHLRSNGAAKVSPTNQMIACATGIAKPRAAKDAESSSGGDHRTSAVCAKQPMEIHARR